MQAAARSARIAKELVDIKREIRKQRQREARTFEILRKMVVNVLTAFFLLTTPSVEPACAYLERKWPKWDSDRDKLRTQLQNWQDQLVASSGIDGVLNPTTNSGQAV